MGRNRRRRGGTAALPGLACHQRSDKLPIPLGDSRHQPERIVAPWLADESSAQTCSYLAQRPDAGLGRGAMRGLYDILNLFIRSGKPFSRSSRDFVAHVCGAFLPGWIGIVRHGLIRFATQPSINQKDGQLPSFCICLSQSAQAPVPYSNALDGCSTTINEPSSATS